MLLRCTKPLGGTVNELSWLISRPFLSRCRTRTSALKGLGLLMPRFERKSGLSIAKASRTALCRHGCWAQRT